MVDVSIDQGGLLRGVAPDHPFRADLRGRRDEAVGLAQGLGFTEPSTALAELVENGALAR